MALSLATKRCLFATLLAMLFSVLAVLSVMAQPCSVLAVAPWLWPPRCGPRPGAARLGPPPPAVLLPPPMSPRPANAAAVVRAQSLSTVAASPTPSPAAVESLPPPPPPPAFPCPLAVLGDRAEWDWSRAGYRDGAGSIVPPTRLFSVESFGALGDGITDDSQALLDALAAAEASADGGVVLLPAGTFVLNRTLTITKPNILIRGAGENSTVISIPSSLTEVQGGKWQASPDGKVRKSAYAFTGGFITITAPEQRSNMTGNLLSTVTGAVSQGDRRIPLHSTALFEVGQWVRIFVNDRSTVEDCDHLGFCRRRRRLQRARVAPAPRTHGSIAWWIFGEGKGSGSDALTAVDQDSVTFTARVLGKDEASITLDAPLPFPVRGSWAGEVHRLVAPVHNSGVESLTVRFKWTKAKSHLNDTGYNAFSLNGIRNCWIRNVSILNADNGIWLHAVDHTLLEGITVNVTRRRGYNLHAPNGHHPMSILHGHSNRVTRFNVAVPYDHDITVGRATLLNVIHQVKGYNLCLDHHRGGPFGNLFSDIDLGCGFRPFDSSGLLDNGAHAGRGNTYYNLRTTNPACPPMRKHTATAGAGASWLPSCAFGPLLNFVGSFVVPEGREDGGKCPQFGWLVAPLSPGSPADVFPAIQAAVAPAAAATGVLPAADTAAAAPVATEQAGATAGDAPLLAPLSF